MFIFGRRYFATLKLHLLFTIWYSHLFFSLYVIDNILNFNTFILFLFYMTSTSIFMNKAIFIHRKSDHFQKRKTNFFWDVLHSMVWKTVLHYSELDWLHNPEGNTVHFRKISVEIRCLHSWKSSYLRWIETDIHRNGAELVVYIHKNVIEFMQVKGKENPTANFNWCVLCPSYMEFMDKLKIK